MPSRFLFLLLFFMLPSCERIDLGENLKAKQTRLKELAEYNFRGEVGAIGYRSKEESSPFTEKWVEIILTEPQLIDQVILVPAIRRDSQTGLQADGFPERFELQIKSESGDVIRLTKENEQGAFLPRIAPLLLPLDMPVRAKSVKVLAHHLGQIGWNDQYFFSLSEVMVFSGEKNVALHQEVRSSGNQSVSLIPTSRGQSYLTDGHLPYGMDAASGGRSVAYLSTHEIGGTQEWSLDLGEKEALEVVRFHRIELDDTIPQSEAGDYAVPSKITITGSCSPDFQEPIHLLAEIEIKSIYDIGPIMSYRLKEQGVRYLRFRFESDSFEEDYGRKIGLVGFAEIELFSQGENKARGKLFHKKEERIITGIGKGRSLGSLTDGENFYGDILPLRKWVEELAMRHELEWEIPIIEREVIKSYTKQKRLAGVGGVVLVLGLLGSWFFSWWIPRRARRKFKERFAAGIHDELGANLHTISFISDQLEDRDLSHDEILQIKGKIRHVAERAGRAVYHMSGVLEDGDLYRGLIDDMERAVERILSTHDHTMSIEGRELLEHIPKKLQVDLLLFYQECLVNIGRHSEAEKFETSLRVLPKNIRLEIRDFGIESEEDAPLSISKSLQRRARILGGKIEVVTPEGGGIIVKLEKKY